MKGLRIGRRRARANGLSSPLELALIPALTDDRWHVPDRFNFTRDVVEALASDPKRRALTFLGKDGVIEPRTFAQIAEGAARWASTLRERGVQPGDRVLVLASSGVDWLEVVLGTIKVGAVTVPCSPALAAAALEVRVSVSEASLVVADHSCEGVIEQMSFSPDVHYFDEGRRRRASDLPDESPTHDTSSRDLAFILSTAGTAGAPKGVAHTHGSVFATRVQAEHWLDAGRGDTVWCTAETDAPQAVWNALVGPWSRGAEVVLHQGEFDPLERLDLLYRLGPTILCQTPAEYRALAELPDLERFRSPRLRRLVSTGDYLEPEVVAAFEERWGMAIHDGYGQSETNIVVANGAEAGFKPGSIGRALPGHHVAIVDDQGNELPAGIEGDLAVRGRPPTLFAGYWESPEETKSAFRGDWYLTGDVALSDEDGFLWFVGRAEDVITSRGRTFGPYEVEHVLRGHEAIAGSAVVGVRDLQRGGHFVRAFVVPKPGVDGSEQLEAELRQYVGHALPEQQVPREIVFVEELPTTGGKVMRHALRERPVGGRPLWEMPPTTEPESEAPPATREPERAPAPATEAAPVLVPMPEPLPTPEPVVPPEPEPVAEAAPVVMPTPSPEPEPEPAPAAEAAPVVVPSPLPAAEAVPVQDPEPESQPVVEPPPAPAPVAEAVHAPELDPVVSEPESTPSPIADAAPAQEPEHTPEFEIAPEPEPLPDLVVESGPEPEPKQVTEAKPEPEPDVVATPGPLPDFVVPRDEAQAKVPPPVPKPEPEPEPEPDLGPLPDYIVDPSRPPEPTSTAPPDRKSRGTPTPFLEVAPGAGSPPAPADLSFPPVTSFPAAREDTDPQNERKREATRTSRPRPKPAPGKPKRGRSTGEPGDEAEEVGWMEGLSNRLSAYSLAEEESSSDESDDDERKDAESA